MIVDVDKIVVSLDVVSPDAVVVEASAVAPSGIVTEAVAELPTQVIVISHEETPTISPLEIIDYGISSIECAFDVATEQAEEVVKGVLCGTTNPPTFENADYRLLHGQGSMDLAFAGLSVNTEYYLRPYALSNLGYKYGDVVAQRTKNNPIPAEYQLVEYLRNTPLINGEIPVNYYANSSTRWEVDFSFSKLNYQYSPNYQMGCGTQQRFIICDANGYYQFGIGSQQTTSISVLYDQVRHHVLDAPNLTLTVDEYSATKTGTITTSESPLTFFRRAGNVFRVFGNLVQSKVYSNDVLALDLYPVYEKTGLGRTGLYDITNNVFYPSTANLGKGPDKEWEE